MFQYMCITTHVYVLSRPYIFLLGLLGGDHALFVGCRCCCRATLATTPPRRNRAASALQAVARTRGATPPPPQPQTTASPPTPAPMPSPPKASAAADQNAWVELLHPADLNSWVELGIVSKAPPPHQATRSKASAAPPPRLSAEAPRSVACGCDADHFHVK